MVSGLLGKKIGMTQIFDKDGLRVPVTVLEAGPCVVQEVKLAEKHGYNAVKLGYDDTKEQRLSKPQREHLKANGLKPKKFVREIRCDDDPGVKTGDEVTNKIFQKGDFLDVTGTSKGKGFQGGMKRCGWAGGVESHGSMSHRAPGSIGASSFPSRVTKGHGMPGQMGNERVTVQNVEVVDIDFENNTVIVKGAVPGANGNYVIMKYAVKKPLAEREVVEKEEPEEQEPQGEAQAREEAGQTEEPQEQARKESKEGNKE